jgi:hypothetical protein
MLFRQAAERRQQAYFRKNLKIFLLRRADARYAGTHGMLPCTPFLGRIFAYAVKKPG